MLTVKIYRQGVCTIVPVTSIAIVAATAASWDIMLAELERASKENLDGREPYKIIVGTSIDGTDVYIGLFGIDTCFITNAEGHTVESVRPKPEPQASGPDNAVPDPDELPSSRTALGDSKDDTLNG